MDGAVLEGVDETLVGLPEAARILGVHRATVNDMVREGRLAAGRDGARWMIRADDLERFAASYVRPPNAPPHRVRGGLLESSRSVLEWLAEFENASAVELAQVIDLHEGNVRKHLRILETKGLVDRRGDGSWHVTPRGAVALKVGPE